MTNPPATVEQRWMEIANAAVEENLNPDGAPKHGTAQGYACALSALSLASRVPPAEDVARAICLALGDSPQREGPWGEWWIKSAYAQAADAILALLADQPANMGGWQSIETAPKDGTDVLLWCVHPNAKCASTTASRSDWVTPVVARWIDHNGGGWTWHGMLGQMTHWRPLPPPPSEGEAL